MPDETFSASNLRCRGCGLTMAEHIGKNCLGAWKAKSESLASELAARDALVDTMRRDNYWEMSHVKERDALQAQVAALTAELEQSGRDYAKVQWAWVADEEKLDALTAKLDKVMEQNATVFNESTRLTNEVAALKRNQEALILTNNDHVAKIGELSAKLAQAIRERDEIYAQVGTLSIELGKTQAERDRARELTKLQVNENGKQAVTIEKLTAQLAQARGALKAMLNWYDRDSELDPKTWPEENAEMDGIVAMMRDALTAAKGELDDAR